MSVREATCSVLSKVENCHRYDNALANSTLMLFAIVVAFAGFPCKYCGPAPVKVGTAAAATPAAPTDTPESILVKWSSKSKKRFDAEELSLSFVRSAGEFYRLPVECQLQFDDTLPRLSLLLARFSADVFFPSAICFRVRLIVSLSYETWQASARA